MNDRELSAEHHYVLRALNETAQKNWLDLAVQEGLSVRELQESVKQGSVVHLYIEDYQKKGGFASVEGVETQFRYLRKQIGDLWKEWTKDEALEFLSHLKQIFDFEQELVEHFKLNE